MCAFHGDYLQGEAHLNQSERLLYLSAQLMLLNMGDGQQKKEEIKMISSELDPRLHKKYFSRACRRSAANGKRRRTIYPAFFRKLCRRFCEIYEKGDFTNAIKV